MRKLGIVALGAAAALTLAGCSAGGDGGNSSDGGTITVWLVGSDTPDTARAYLKDTFESENEGWKLTVEQKTWADVSDTYAAALQSNDSPDLVEVGNTQTASFADQGLFQPITDLRDELGGDDFLGGLEDSATYDGDLYAAPYYAGGRIVFYSEQVLGDTALPKTLDEYVASGKARHTDTVSGIYAPGRDWYNALAYVWANDGFIAEQDGDAWKAGFSSEGGIKGLSMLQDVYTNASNAAKDGDETDPQVPFCAGEVVFLSAPAWVQGSIQAAADAENPGCADTFGSDLGAFALPGLTAGETAPIFAGGSNIGVATKSKNPEQAEKALAIMTSTGYQELMAEAGLTPGIESAASALPDTPVAQAQAEALANSKVTPTTPKWAEVEAAQIIQEALVKIAQGGDVTEIATGLDKQIEDILNS
ncbi:extracellular solute-binding protein [Agromyces archimandritae]|uniref:Extracellular solute-binding protein n=1 Tax=Agromyces archimandritae TaxID=2781962 RepID=A0A975FL31_9MICO|nr:extracellular solute-binding protein [Agromyces archimandritae]QTX03929.1 extracellular solute-binding protein [Agromyces archimandritae]